jgi:hypothetical protein
MGKEYFDEIDQCFHWSGIIAFLASTCKNKARENNWLGLKTNKHSIFNKYFHVMRFQLHQYMDFGQLPQIAARDVPEEN